MRKLGISCASLVILMAICSPILAHHGSAASYVMDPSKVVTMTGTVTRFSWANPHVFIQYDVNDGKGNIVHWSAETHPPNVLSRSHGWTEDILKPGDRITIALFPAKSGNPVGLLAKIVLNGKVLLDDQQLRLRQQNPNANE
jgi:hypothetical protein